MSNQVVWTVYYTKNGLPCTLKLTSDEDLLDRNRVVELVEKISGIDNITRIIKRAEHL